MAGQLALVAKLMINMHSLNTERAEEIRRVPLVYKINDGYKVVEEAVAVSGVMLKHYHFTTMVEYLRRDGGKLCPFCKRGIAIRMPSKRIPKSDLARILGVSENNKELERYYQHVQQGSEGDIISSCAGEDIHGFLRPDPPLRRESLVKFSWLLPSILSELEDPTMFTVVQHTRVIPNIPENLSEDAKQLQMPYPRGYGNGVFGFVSLANLELVGVPITGSGERVIDGNEKSKRQRAIIRSYAPLIGSVMGASMAKALPAYKTLEVMLVIVKNSPVSIPVPVHPMYDNYVNDTLKIFSSYRDLTKANVRVYTYGVRPSETYGLDIERVSRPLDVLMQAEEFLLG